MLNDLGLALTQLVYVKFLFRFCEMGIVAEFLENSSICGWAHIANSKTKIERAYWIIVSVLMIAGAGYLIADAFDDWANNPIATITEPETISRVKFPQIVVCPPKVSFSFTCFEATMFRNVKRLSS